MTNKGSTVEDETENENSTMSALQEMLHRHSLELSETEDSKESCQSAARLPSSSCFVHIVGV